MALHDQLLVWLVSDYLHVALPDVVTQTEPVTDLRPYAGTYRSNQIRVDVSVVDGQLEEQMAFEPLDDELRRIVTGFVGSPMQVLPPRRYVPVRKDLFAPAGMPLQAFNGYTRSMLISYHGAADGRPTHRCAGGRMTRRDPAA